MHLILNRYVNLKCMASKTKTLDILVRNGISCVKLMEYDEFVVVTIPKLDENYFKKRLNESCINFEPVVFSKWIKFSNYMQGRIGLIIGAIMLILCVYASSKIVWNINVIGNKTVSDDEILLELKAAGFEEGSLVPNIDFDKLHNKVLKNTKNLSWISINMDGNVANVQVKEKENNQAIEEGGYSNIVAKNDGQIVSIIIKNGKKVVGLKEVVKKGQLLISGVLDSQSEGVRYVDSSGIILAEVSKNIDIKIPLKQTVLEKSGHYQEESILKIFNSNIFFLRKCRNLYNEYDTIKIRNSPICFGIQNLPIEFTTIRYREINEKEVEYTKEEAVELALKQLRYELDSVLKDAEIVSKNIKTTFDGECVFLNCSLICIEDICERVEFIVEN